MREMAWSTQLQPLEAPGEHARRLAVWAAFSDLFLDTDTNIYFPTVLRVAESSGYSGPELEEILWQVASCFGTNLFSVTGVWDGWSLAYVERSMVSCASLSVPRTIWQRAWVRIALSWYIRPLWQTIDARLTTELKAHHTV